MYTFLKVLLDPIVFVLGLIAVGFLYSLRDRKTGLKRIWFVLFFLILYGLITSPLPNGLSYILERECLRNSGNVSVNVDAVVVLGGGIMENRYLKETIPSYQTASRLLYAVQVFRESGARYLICMGKGVGRISEGEVMCRAAERLGVPADMIKVDPYSVNTWEHAEELNKMFREKDIRIGLVTSAYHMRRSEREFRKYFNDVTPLPSDYLYTSPSLSIFTFMPGSGNLYKFAVAFNEIIGIGWYRIRGWGGGG